MKRLNMLSTLGLVGLIGCSDPDKNEILSRGNIENVEIRYINTVRSFEYNGFCIEIYDSNNQLRAVFDNVRYGYIQYDDDQKIDLANGKVIRTEEEK